MRMLFRAGVLSLILGSSSWGQPPSISISTRAAPTSQKSVFAPAQVERSLWPIYQTLGSKNFVDLTHSFNETIPHWKGYPEERRKTLYTYEDDGFWAEQFTLVGQWGTHADAPAHFHPGLRTLDEIPVREMVAPLVVLDISSRCVQDPDATCSVEDVLRWERMHGRIPEGAFVALRTGWSLRWPDPDLMQNRDPQGRMHYPGWSAAALKFLVEERKIVAVGHETTDTDPGFEVREDRYPAQTYLHGKDKFQIELLDNLDQVPEAGAIVIAAFPKPEKASGFPARVFAILP